MIGNNLNFIVDINELKRKYIFQLCKTKTKVILSKYLTNRKKKTKVKTKSLLILKTIKLHIFNLKSL